MYRAVADRSEILMMVIENEPKTNDIQETHGEEWISFHQLMRNISQYSKDGVSMALDKLKEEGYVERKFTDRNRNIIKPTEEGKDALPWNERKEV